MPRPKIIRINAAELNIWRELANELSGNPLFKECDFDNVEIVSKERTPDPVIKDIEKPIIRLERFIRNNGNRSVGKKNLCEIMKISRPTLNKWIDDEFISKGNKKESWSLQQFDLKKVVSELKKQRNITKKQKF
jgi:hypothetical protein